MAIESSLQGDHFINGNLRSKVLLIPTGTVTNAGVNANAGIAATKLEHQNVLNYSQESGTTSATGDFVIHTVYGLTGSVVAFKAGSVTACAGAATITVDLHNNGASILTDPIELDSGSVAYIAEAGSVDTTALDVGDVLEVVIVATAGGGTIGDGVFATLIERELSA